MEFNELSIWLKETILGVIILGACGSALCIGFFKFVSSLFLKWLPNSFKRYREKRYQEGYLAGQIYGYLHFTDHKNGIVVTMLSKVVSILSYLIFASVLLILFLILFLNGGSVLTISSYIVLLTSMIMFFSFYRKVSDLNAINQIVVSEALEGIKEVIDSPENKESVPE